MEGGAVKAATMLDSSREDLGHFRPQFLPDGKHFLFLIESAKPGNSGVYAGSLDSKEAKPILPDLITTASYVSSGQILFVRGTTLFAQNFDVGQLELQDKPIRIADSIITNSNNAGFAAFSASESGVLVYRMGDFRERNPSQLTWFDRHGNVTGTIGAIDVNLNPRLSPDGSRAAVQIAEESGSAIWVLGPGATSRRVAADSLFPLWSPDGRQLLYDRRRDGKATIVKRLVDGDGGEEELLSTSLSGHFDDWSPGGTYLVLSLNRGQTNRDILAVPVGVDPKPLPIAATAADELYGRISPDGHWIAYQSNESGTEEIYLQAFPHAGIKTLVSRNGGRWPVWRPDGKELFYLSLDEKKLWAVSISGGSTIQPGSPEALFDVHVTSGGGIGTPSKYDVTSNGQKFLVNVAASDAPEISPIHVILNWTELLKR
jgi:Tol biopolymer transport system component